MAATRVNRDEQTNVRGFGPFVSRWSGFWPQPRDFRRSSNRTSPCGLAPTAEMDQQFPARAFFDAEIIAAFELDAARVSVRVVRGKNLLPESRIDSRQRIAERFLGCFSEDCAQIHLHRRSMTNILPPFVIAYPYQMGSQPDGGGRPLADPLKIADHSCVNDSKTKHWT
jgi:hypothetical protein